MKGKCPYCNKKIKISDQCKECGHKLDSWDKEIAAHPPKRKVINGYMCEGSWDLEKGGYTYGAIDMGN